MKWGNGLLVCDIKPIFRPQVSECDTSFEKFLEDQITGVYEVGRSNREHCNGWDEQHPLNSLPTLEKDVDTYGKKNGVKSWLGKTADVRNRKIFDSQSPNRREMSRTDNIRGFVNLQRPDRCQGWEDIPWRHQHRGVKWLGTMDIPADWERRLRPPSSLIVRQRKLPITNDV